MSGTYSKFDKDTVLKKIELSRSKNKEYEGRFKFGLTLTLNQSGKEDYTVYSNVEDKVEIIRELVDLISDNSIL